MKKIYLFLLIMSSIFIYQNLYSMKKKRKPKLKKKKSLSKFYSISDAEKASKIKKLKKEKGTLQDEKNTCYHLVYQYTKENKNIQKDWAAQEYIMVYTKLHNVLSTIQYLQKGEHLPLKSHNEIEEDLFESIACALGGEQEEGEEKEELPK